MPQLPQHEKLTDATIACYYLPQHTADDDFFRGRAAAASSDDIESQDTPIDDFRDELRHGASTSRAAITRFARDDYDAHTRA